MAFNFTEAFSRNIGWLTENEQQQLRGKSVAIAGLGGVGGIHLLTLARLGIEHFRLAEFDHYELVNFNRQAGATMQTLGQPKLDVMASMAHDVNPHIEIMPFNEGITTENVDAFLSGADLYIDGIDFFAMSTRSLIFARCAALGIPAITAGPIGMGVAYLIYMPGGMTFEEYFGLQPLTETQQFLRYLLGLTPTMLHRRYLVDDTRLNLAQRTGPSTMIACNLCAGVACAEALKILLHRGKVYPMPYYHLFDAYENRYIRGRLYGGAHNPLMRLKTSLGFRQISRRLQKRQAPPPSTPTTPIERILDAARWAPSGDNTQPWRFRLIDAHSVEVSYATAPLNIYEYRNGEPIHLAVGMLLETIGIAAAQEKLRCTWEYHEGKNAMHRILIRFSPSDAPAGHVLYPYIRHRSVNRRRYQKTSLNSAQKQALSDALGEKLHIEWYEEKVQKHRTARLNALATDIRLRIPEAYAVHKNILEWDKPFSEEKVPVRTLPINPLSRAVMRWAMQRWKRIAFLNRYLAGTKGPQLEMDMLPGRHCAAHFFISSLTPCQGDIPALLEAGAALQRFWLTATSLGLVLQPSLATLIFAHYGREHLTFTEKETMMDKASHLAEALSGLRSGAHSPDAQLLFAGRIGYPLTPKITSRSLRKPLEALMTA